MHPSCSAYCQLWVCPCEQYENSEPERTGPNARQSIDTDKRARAFRQQFSTYSFPDKYFEVSGKDGTTQFDRDCDRILDSFKSKFLAGAQDDRKGYLDTFSLAKWHELPVAERKQHSLSNCVSCFLKHFNRQCSFPMKPVYQHKPSVVVDEAAFQRQGLAKFTDNVLTELNRVYEHEAGTSFNDAVVLNKSSGLQKRTDKRAEMVKVKKQLTKAVNEQFSEKAAISMLSECESRRKYHRKRMAQSFCTSTPPPAKKKKKSHSPDFSNVTWDKEKLKETLENLPEGTVINWSQVARDHGIPGKNAGQVVKEFSETTSVDLSKIVTPKRKPTVRPRRRKLPGTEISIPSNPPLNAINDEINSMIASGRFTIGVECAPYTITTYKVVDGVMTAREREVQGRKVPLTDIRQHLLDKQKKYMRLTPDSSIATMSKEELSKKLSVPCDGKSEEELRDMLRHSERHRCLCLWHDHATFLKRGFVLVTYIRGDLWMYRQR